MLFGEEDNAIYAEGRRRTYGKQLFTLMRLGRSVSFISLHSEAFGILSF